MLPARSVCCAVFVLLALTPAAVMSQEAFTRQVANVRAGPDRSYPLVNQLPPGAPVRVMGCLDDWSWCDVGFDDSRGWVYAPFLLYGVPDDRVSLYTYGPSLGIPIIGFALDSYWDEHYRQRAWYGSREEWSHREPPQHHAPTGLPPHAVYTAGMHPDRGGHAAGRSAAAEGHPHEAARSAPREAPHDAEREAPHAAPHEAQREAPRAAPHAAPHEAPHEAQREAPHAAPREAAQHAAPAGEHTQGAARAPEHGPAPRAEAGSSAERGGPPPAAREAPRRMEHVPERPSPDARPEKAERGGERGGERSGPEEKR